MNYELHFECWSVWEAYYCQRPMSNNSRKQLFWSLNMLNVVKITKHHSICIYDGPFIHECVFCLFGP